MLELANRDLLDSHLQAVWLSCVDQPLDPCIAELLALEDASRPLHPDLQAALQDRRVADRAGERIRRVLDLVADDLTSETAPWYTGRDAYADTVVASAAERFDGAFHRWRDLFAAAEEQRDAARRTMDDYSTPYREKRAAQTRHAQAVDQLTLLQRGTSALSSDFYTYRYLATEGFLPGYNFPRLPLLAYVPAGRDGRGRQTYLQRPRFLALAEFGPRSLVYHEGRAHRVVRALLALGHRESATPDAQLPTRAVRVCADCGAGHFGRRSVDVPLLRSVARQCRRGRQHVPDRERRHAAGRADHGQRRGAPAPGLRPADDVRVGDPRPGSRRTARDGPRRGG